MPRMDSASSTADVDTIGARSVLESASQRFATDCFIQEVLYSIADILVMVVNDFSASDQESTKIKLQGLELELIFKFFLLLLIQCCMRSGTRSSTSR